MRIHDVEQGTPEWLECRRGILTASEVKLILTPTLKIANNDKTRAHMWELLAQRVSGYIEPCYIGDDMLRGMSDEFIARDLYSSIHEPVREVGFITNEIGGVVMGYSPDGLAGDKGAIEIKSRRQKFQIQTIATDEVPSEYVMQLQTGILVAELDWIDFISYSAGLPMFVKRVFPDDEIQEAIKKAASEFEINITQLALLYEKNAQRFFETERPEELKDEEIVV